MTSSVRYKSWINTAELIADVGSLEAIGMLYLEHADEFSRKLVCTHTHTHTPTALENVAQIFEKETKRYSPTHSHSLELYS